MSSQPGRPESESLFELFKNAVEDERKAQSVYAQALDLCSDPALRPILQGLIEDERRHELLLIDRYNAMARLRAGRSTSGPAASEPAPAPAPAS